MTVRVVDANTGAPLAGALVTACGAAATTGTGGVARLDVPPGTCVVRVTKSGYSPASQAVSVVAPSSVTVRLVPVAVIL